MPHEPHAEVVVVDVPQTNSAGFWGFVLSLLGVTCCAGTCLTWVGLILSLIGLGKEPRGFAVAGTVLGIIGTTGGLVFWGSGGRSVVRLARNVGLMEVQTYRAMWSAEQYVLDAYDDTGRLPATFDDATGGGLVFTDQWGTDLVYRVRPDGNGYEFHSAGPDTAWGTGDELSYVVRDADQPGEFTPSRGTVRLLDATSTTDPDELGTDLPTGVEVEQPAETPESDGG
ncbi:MAG: DUF4190 domain-containing protein [Phycisphaerales bacterium JB040]